MCAPRGAHLHTRAAILVHAFGLHHYHCRGHFFGSIPVLCVRQWSEVVFQVRADQVKERTDADVSAGLLAAVIQAELAAGDVVVGGPS